jgi:NAD(P)-dependent dehydrogenase (short-subunit alcohol dehydrogenase family)
MAKAATTAFSEALASEVGPLGMTVTSIEPGAFRTFSAREKLGRVQQASPSAHYQATVGHLLGSMGQIAGHEPGDPAKTAQAILAVVNEQHLPRRLLGRDAVQLARQVDQADLAEIERWEPLSTSVDDEGLTHEAESERAFQALLNMGSDAGPTAGPTP